MTYKRRPAAIGDIEAHLTLSLYIRDTATETFAGYSRAIATIREDNGDTEETIYASFATGFIDDNSVISDGVTTITEWLTASGATNAYVVTEYSQDKEGLNVTQANTSLQPQLVLNGAGVLADILHVSQSLEVTYTEFNSIPTSTFLVLNINDNTGTSNYLFSHTLNSVSSNKRELSIPPSGEELLSTGNDDSTTIFRGFYGSPVGYNTNQLYYLGSNGIDNTVGRKNGVAVFNETTTNVGGYNNRHDRYRIGGGFVGTSNNTVIREVISYKGQLSTSQIEEVENQLMTTYGIV